MFTRFLTLESSREDPHVTVLPVPYDSTASWGAGARFGPEAMIHASNYVETYDEELGVTIQDARVFIMEPVEPHIGSTEEMARRIETMTDAAAETGGMPLILGGDHSVTIGAARAMARRHPPLSFLHIDAHADMRNSYEGSRFSHACTARRLTELGRVVQVGIRSLSEEESLLVGSATTVFWARDINESRDNAWISQVTDALGPDVYITFDVDALDPAVMPATGTPEPGGLTYRHVLDLITAVMQKKRVVGADVVELSPVPGLNHPQFTVARILLRMMAAAFGRPVR